MPPANDAQKAPLFLVTHMRVTADPPKPGADPEELVAAHKLTGCNIAHEAEARKIAQQKKLGDHRLTGVRVFEILVADDGTPLVGDELTA